ncbi:MAG: nodulation protein NfeD [Tissierellia bacterium]|nr:nodulation protein NfeD [Tissierellia bacterium]
MKKTRFFLVLFLVLIQTVYGKEKENALVIPIEGEINNATSTLVNDGIDYAKEKNFDRIIFKIDTYGGRIVSAERMKNAMIASPIPTISFVNNKAESAGVLLTIASEEVYMDDMSTIGSAEPIPNNEKNLSFWRSLLQSTANYRHRNSKVVMGMADKDIVIEGITEKGKLINLNNQQAEELKISDGTYSSLEHLAKDKNFNLDYYKPNASVQFLSLISTSMATSILLAIAMVGMVVEIMTPGFGVGGTLSIISFGLFFMGNIMAGNSVWYSVILFLLGLLLVGIELIVPGFGLPGIGGIIFLVVGIVLAIGDLSLALISFSTALILSLIVGYFLFKRGMRLKLFQKVQLQVSSTKDRGYISSDEPDLLPGDEGITATPLRPSGYGIFRDKRFEVLSDRGYVLKNQKIVVVRIEGSKVFVHQKEEKEV